MSIEKSPNWFVRILIILFAGYLIYISWLHFSHQAPLFSLSAASLALLSLITLIILSEGFDKLSFGKILSLERELSKKKEEVSTLKDDNRILRNDVLSLVQNISNSNKQSQMTVIIPEAFRQATVVKADKEEIVEEKDSEKAPPQPAEPDQQPVEQTPDEALLDSYSSRRKILEMAEEEIVSKYIQTRGLSAEALQRDVALSPLFSGIDPVMERSGIYDGYLNTGDSEIFIEMASDYAMTPSFLDRLYMQLMKVYFYREAKKSRAALVFLFYTFPTGKRRMLRISIEKLISFFQPAIKNSLLLVEVTNFTQEDLKRFATRYREQMAQE